MNTRLRKIVSNTTVAVVSLGLAVLGVVYAPWWLIGASLAVIAGMLVTVGTNLYWTPTSYRRLNKKMAKASATAALHPILLRFYNDGVAKTERELDSITKGRFNFTVTEVPELSVHAMNLVDKTCILIFPLEQSEALLTPETGTASEYYNAMVAASARIDAAGSDGVIRIFLLNRRDDISTRLLHFIRRNLEGGILVRLIFEDELPPRPAAIECLDFGYYETQTGHEWVMLLRHIETTETATLTDYVVDTDPHSVSEYYRFGQEILARSRVYEEFLALLTKPMNADLWPKYFAERGFEMFPPHGLSEEDANHIVRSAMRGITAPEEASVLILGFTPKLIRPLVEKSIGRVVSLDYFESKPSEFEGVAKFETGNWLDAILSERFDIILFDEALNNLSRLQLSLFFPRLRAMLKPRGHVIGRIMGRFDDKVSRKYLDRNWWDAASDLRKVAGSSHEDFAPLVICLMHSRHLAFDSDAEIVDCRRWNMTLSELREDDRITEDEHRSWRLRFNFRLFSPELDTLLEEARQAGLSPFEIRKVQGKYVESCPDTTSFYRIINFESTPAAGLQQGPQE